MYRKIFDTDGKLVAINRLSDGAFLSFYSDTKTFNESHPLTIELREWESINGLLDLSDIPINPIVTNYFRIYSLVDSDSEKDFNKPPFGINYNTDLKIGLTTKTIDYFGLRVAQIFYQSLDALTKNPISPIPIVFERYYYEWDNLTNLPLRRKKNIQFYLEDGTLSEETKILPKEFYNTSDRSEIVYYRRKTIVSWLIARSVELGLGTALQGFFAQFKDECDRYILYGDDAILTSVNASTLPWMDADTTTEMGTVKNAIALCFGKALEPTPNSEVDSYLSTIL